MAKIIDLRNQMPGGQSKRNINQIKKIVRHHSASTNGDALAFARYHTQSLGWKTSGYHEVILRDGTVQLCYDPNVITNGVGNHNNYTYHICLVGNANFTAAQEQAFLERAEAAMKLFNLKVSDVLGHKEFKGHESNTCPGIDMNKVRSSLNQYIANKKEVNKQMQEHIKRLEERIFQLERQLAIQNSKDPSDWAKKDWQEAVENGYFDGTRPRANITREQAAIIVNRLRRNFLALIGGNREMIEKLEKRLAEIERKQ